MACIKESSLIFGQVEVPTTGVVNLPRECLFEARFFRIVVLTASTGLGGTEATPESTALGVRWVHGGHGEKA